MKPFDLSLYLVLDPTLCEGPQGMLETARLAAENGASMVQLRAPDWKKRQWLETAMALKAVLDPLGVPLIINDHLDIALAVDAAGGACRPIRLATSPGAPVARARQTAWPVDIQCRRVGLGKLGRSGLSGNWPGTPDRDQIGCRARNGSGTVF